MSSEVRIRGHFLRTRIATALVVAIVAALASAVAAPPAGAVGADEAVPLVGAPQDSVTDPVTGHVFVAHSFGVSMYDADLGFDETIATGHSSALLIFDRALYVGGPYSSEVSVVDPASGAIIRRIALGINGVRSFAGASDGRIWFTSGSCNVYGSFDPANPEAPVVRVVANLRCATFVSGTAPRGRLVLTENDVYPTKLHLLDSEQPTALPIATVTTATQYLRDAEFTEGGTTFVTAQQYPRRLVEWATSSLTETGRVYETDDIPPSRVDVVGARIAAAANTYEGRLGFFTFAVGVPHPYTIRRYSGTAYHHTVVLSSTGHRLYYSDVALRWTHVCTVGGTAYDDILVGTEAADVICGNGGDDVLRGRGGADRLDGGDGADMLAGGAGDDLLLGDRGDTAVFDDSPAPVTVDLTAGSATGHGADTLRGVGGAVGSAYSDVLYGGPFGDRLEGGPGNDRLDGRAGSDTASFTSAASGVSLNLAARSATGAGSDRLISMEWALGSPHADVMTGDSGANRLDGGGGADRIFGGLGEDFLMGGDGNDLLSPGPDRSDDQVVGGNGGDTISYSDATASVEIDLSRRWSPTGNDSLWQTERAAGGPFDDVLVGSHESNVLSGGKGDDRIEGGGGPDVVRGGPGNDVVGGGPGDDDVAGDAGDDALGGSQGNDSMSGGDGVDLCVQGSGTGTRSMCESTENQIRIGDAGVREHDGPTTVVVPFSLAAPTDQPVSVAWSTANGTATVREDFGDRAETLTFPPDVTQMSVTLDIPGDGITEGDEEFYVFGADAVGASLAKSTAVVGILDDDRAQVSVSDAVSEEGSASAPGVLRFSVTLAKASSAPVTIELRTVAGSATAATDYVHVACTVTIAPSQLFLTVDIGLVGDASAEADESLELVIVRIENGDAVDPSGEGLILDDDA